MNINIDLSFLDEPEYQPNTEILTLQEENAYLRMEIEYVLRQLKKYRQTARELANYILDHSDAQPPIEIIDLTNDN